MLDLTPELRGTKLYINAGPLTQHDLGELQMGCVKDCGDN
jgi:hypothetical protein